MPIKRTKKTVDEEFLTGRPDLSLALEHQGAFDTDDYQLAGGFPEILLGARPLDEKRLLLEFENLEKKIFDLSNDLRTHAFGFLNEPGLLQQVILLDNGRSIGWENPQGELVSLEAATLYFGSEPAEAAV